MRKTVTFCFALLGIGCLAAAWASTPIGVATAQGAFMVDKARAEGNATVFDGTTLETMKSESAIRLNSGAWLKLGAGSRAKLFAGRLVLERGEGRIERAGRLRIEAQNLLVSLEGASPAAAVSVVKPGSVRVEALAGETSVRTPEGVLVARLAPGTALELQPQAGASAPVSVTGCLTAQFGNKYILKDETANVVFEVRGADLAKYAGQRVAIKASIIPQVAGDKGVSQVVQALEVKSLGPGCPAAAAKDASSGSKSTGAAKSAAMSAGTKKAIIAGVVIAAAAGGTAVGLTGAEDKDNKAISR